MAVLYHWKHGWIPLDHVAALSKAKGNHAAALKMLSDSHGHDVGIRSRQDVAKAVRDLPNVPAEHRAHAHKQLTEAAEKHGAHDLLPKTGRSPGQTEHVTMKEAKPSSSAAEAWRYARGLSDTELEEARGRQLSARVRKAVEAEHTARAGKPTGREAGATEHVTLKSSTPAPKGREAGATEHVTLKSSTPAKSYDAKSYARGWKASQGGGSGSLERADNRREPPEWYDGYLDHSVGRPQGFSKTHTPAQREAYDRGELDANGKPIAKASPGAGKSDYELSKARHDAARERPTPSAGDLTDAAEQWKRDHPGEKLAGHEAEVLHIANDLAYRKRLRGGDRGQDTAAQAAAEQERKRTGASGRFNYPIEQREASAPRKAPPMKAAASPTRQPNAGGGSHPTKPDGSPDYGAMSAEQAATIRAKQAGRGVGDHVSTDRGPGTVKAVSSRGTTIEPDDPNESAFHIAAGTPGHDRIKPSTGRSPGQTEHVTLKSSTMDDAIRAKARTPAPSRAEQDAADRAKGEKLRADRAAAASTKYDSDVAKGTDELVKHLGLSGADADDARRQIDAAKAKGLPSIDLETVDGGRARLSLKKPDDGSIGGTSAGTVTPLAPQGEPNVGAGKVITHADQLARSENLRGGTGHTRGNANISSDVAARQLNAERQARLAKLDEGGGARGDLTKLGGVELARAASQTGDSRLRTLAQAEQRRRADEIRKAPRRPNGTPVVANGKAGVVAGHASTGHITVRHTDGRVQNYHPRDVTDAGTGRSPGQTEHVTLKSSTMDDAIRAKARNPGGSKRTSAELKAAAEAKRAEAQRIADNAGTGDRAAGRLKPSALRQANRRTDSDLRRYTEASNAARELEHKAGLQGAREREAARTRFDPEDVKGATHVQTDTGWHEVVRVNAKSVTVKTPYSWTDSIKHEKIHKIAKPGDDGKPKIHGPNDVKPSAPDSNPHQRDPAATSRPRKISEGETQRAQARADATTAETMRKISDEQLQTNIDKYRASAPGSAVLKVLLAEQHRRRHGR